MTETTNPAQAPASTEPGDEMHRLARELFPICRSITGDGVRKTLGILRDRMMPGLAVHEVPSGTPCFDWTVPREWNIRDAYVVAPNGEKVVDFKTHNLHVVGYSVPVDQVLELEQLQSHLHSIPEKPDAIPYVTSYYAERWGFCLTHRQRQSLAPGRYRAVIDSTLAPGSLSYGELVLPGETEHEVFFSTYVCHPSMANNELSGPVVAAALAREVAARPHRRLTYRFVFIPETIGSLVYLSRNLAHLRRDVIAGFNVTCVGDERAYSFLPSRAGDTLADRTAKHVLRHHAPSYLTYSYLDRGSDERQYCAPGVDLPVASLMRSKYACYPEYHSSLDDLSVVTPAGLAGSLLALRRCVDALEANVRYRVKVLGEPQLGRRGLYPTISTGNVGESVRTMMNLIAYADGTRDLLAIGETIGRPAWELAPVAALLKQHDLLEVV